MVVVADEVVVAGVDWAVVGGWAGNKQVEVHAVSAGADVALDAAEGAEVVALAADEGKVVVGHGPNGVVDDFAGGDEEVVHEAAPDLV